MATNTTPADEPADGRPQVAGETARTGWYRSPGGHPTFADGPDQRRALGDRGYVEIGEDEAKQLVADRAKLTVDRSDVKGTFDDDAVRTAVREESTGPKKSTTRRRST